MGQTGHVETRSGDAPRRTAALGGAAISYGSGEDAGGRAAESLVGTRLCDTVRPKGSGAVMRRDPRGGRGGLTRHGHPPGHPSQRHPRGRGSVTRPDPEAPCGAGGRRARGAAGGARGSRRGAARGGPVRSGFCRQPRAAAAAAPCSAFRGLCTPRASSDVEVGVRRRRGTAPASAPLSAGPLRGGGQVPSPAPFRRPRSPGALCGAERLRFPPPPPPGPARPGPPVGAGTAGPPQRAAAAEFGEKCREKVWRGAAGRGRRGSAPSPVLSAPRRASPGGAAPLRSAASKVWRRGRGMRRAVRGREGGRDRTELRSPHPAPLPAAAAAPPPLGARRRFPGDNGGGRGAGAAGSGAPASAEPGGGGGCAAPGGGGSAATRGDPSRGRGGQRGRGAGGAPRSVPRFGRGRCALSGGDSCGGDVGAARRGGAVRNKSRSLGVCCFIVFLVFGFWFFSLPLAK